MRLQSFRTPFVLGMLATASMLQLAAQTTQFVVNPTSLVFTDSTAQTITVTTSTGAFALSNVSCPAGLTCVYNDTGINVATPRQTPFTIRATPNSALGSTQESIVITALGVQQTNIPITYSGVGGTTTFIASPNPLTFTYAVGTTASQSLNLLISGPSTSVPYNVTASGGLVPYLIYPVAGNTGQSISIALTNPSIIPTGTTGQLTFTPTVGGFTGTVVNVQANQTGSTGSPLVVNPGSFNFTYPVGTTAQQRISFNVSGIPQTSGFTTVASTILNGQITIPQGGAPNTTYEIVLLNPSNFTAVTNATITFTESIVGGTSIVVPVTINPTGSTSGSIVVSPNPISFNFTAGASTQVVNVQTSGPPPGTPFTTFVSGSAASYVTVPLNGNIGNLLQVAIPNTTIVPIGTSGSITFTPAAPYLATTVPIIINGSGIGGGSLSLSSTNLTFNAAVGSGTSTPTQFVTVNSNDITQPSQFFNYSFTSTNNFLTVTANSQNTPATLTIGVNAANITTSGVYTGTINLTGFTTNASSQTITVTLNVTGGATVTPDQASLSLSIPAGTNVVQSRTINLTSPSTGVLFAASAVSTPNFLSVSASSTTVPAALTVTVNPSGLAVGTYTGNVLVTTGTTTAATIPVTLTITPAGTLQVSPAQLSFSFQSNSTSLPPAQSLAVTSTGAQGLTFNTAASTASGGNWLQITSSTGTTPGSATISVLPSGLAAGTYNGAVTITSSGASNSPVTVPVVLTVTTPAVPQITSFVNGASFGPAAAAPGLIFTIFGRDLGPTTLTRLQVANGAVTTTLANTRVLFDGVPAPIVYTSDTQLSAIVPYEVAGRFTTRLQVEYNGQLSAPVELRVVDSAPAIFTLNAQGTGQGAILNQDGAPNVPNNPETRGRSIVIYATGEGQTSAQGITGRITLPIASDLRRPLLPVVVRIGGRPAVVEYAGSAPGFVAGLIQINVRTPLDAPTGTNVPIEIQIGTSTSQAGATVALR